MNNNAGPKRKIMTGNRFLMGNVALAQGVVAAGCEFAAGYPITPASEIINHLAAKLPENGGIVYQTEDEISAVAAIIGASWAGMKSMTATSGPGISLMQENIGFAVATETPIVIVDVQRMGPSTGVPSIGLTGDIVQVARGSHGDYQIVALSPDGPREMFDLTIRAFNLAETYRVPVFLMADGFIGHMRERVEIPPVEEIETVYRKTAQGNDPLLRQDFLDENVAPMPVFGRGCKAHVTSSCHDEHGMRNLSDPAVMHRFITKPIDKIRKHREDIVQVESDIDDAEIVLIAYGAVSRSAKAAAALAREAGMKVGVLRLVTCWPLPDLEIREAARQADRVFVMENNTGQLFPYIKAETARDAETTFLGPEVLGQIHDPRQVVGRIKEAIQ